MEQHFCSNELLVNAVDNILLGSAILRQIIKIYCVCLLFQQQIFLCGYLQTEDGSMLLM